MNITFLLASSPPILALAGRSFLHRHNPLARVVQARTLRTNLAADLQIAPTRRAVDAMQYQSRPSRRALHANFHEALKERGSIEVEHSGPVSYTHLRAHETPEHLVC